MKKTKRTVSDITKVGIGLGIGVAVVSKAGAGTTIGPMITQVFSTAAGFLPIATTGIMAGTTLKGLDKITKKKYRY